MSLYRLYAALAVVGVILPYTLFVPWLAAHGFDLPLLMSQPLVNLPARIFVVDVVFAAFVFLIFVIVEGRRLGIPHLWAPPLAILAAGLCCALPLFLAQRERAMARQAPEAEQSDRGTKAE